MKKLLTLLATLLIAVSLTGCQKEKTVKLKEVYDHVFDAGTYTELDYDYAEQYFKEHYDNYGGG